MNSAKTQDDNKAMQSNKIIPGMEVIILRNLLLQLVLSKTFKSYC